MAIPSKILEQIEAFPSLPVTVSKVMEVTSNPESSANDLMKAVLPDQGMCVAILKTANSALYGRPKKISSVENAIMVLGFEEVQSIVLGNAALKTFQPLLKNWMNELDDFWDHSFTCGLAARLIGEHLGLSPGHLFIAGLLHDIGKLAMLIILGEDYDTAHFFYGLSNPSKLEEEEKAFFTSHDVVGSELLKSWLLPETLAMALGYHHSPQNAPELNIYPHVVQLADCLTHIVNSEFQDEVIIEDQVQEYLPGFVTHWMKNDLPLDETSLELWFNWLQVDRKHGSGILDILTS